jgi:hypothetical protein
MLSIEMGHQLILTEVEFEADVTDAESSRRHVKRTAFCVSPIVFRINKLNPFSTGTGNGTGTVYTVPVPYTVQLYQCAVAQWRKPGIWTRVQFNWFC